MEDNKQHDSGNMLIHCLSYLLGSFPELLLLE